MDKTKIVLIIFALAITSVFSAGCNSRVEKSITTSVVYVKVEDVSTKEWSFPIHSSGLLAAKEEAMLSFRALGIVDQILVNEGETVKKGQLLAKLNLAETNQKIEKALSAYEKAQRDLQRAEDLYTDNMDTLERKQNAVTAMEIRKSNLEIAQFNLEYAHIYAPNNGRIMKCFVEIHELVDVGDPVFNFGTANNEWIVRVGITDRDVVRLRLGDAAVVSFDAYPGRQFSASVTEIAEAVDPKSGTFEAEVTIHKEEAHMISGFSARVDIIPSVKSLLSFVPIEAIVEGDGNSAFVFAVNDDSVTVRKIPVSVVKILEGEIALKPTLTGFKRVVTDGSPYLTHGAEIVIR